MRIGAEYAARYAQRARRLQQCRYAMEVQRRPRGMVAWRMRVNARGAKQVLQRLQRGSEGEKGEKAGSVHEEKSHEKRTA